MSESFNHPPEPSLPPGHPPAVPRFDLQDLMQGGREVLIHHKGEWYRLSITRNEKLILHK